MSLIVKGGGTFTPAPDGLHAAVCVDVIDVGMVTGMYGEKHKIRLVWELDATMDDGRRYVASKQYTASLHEKSSLYKDLKSWRGKPFTAEELAGFDLERLLGAPAQLFVTHEERDGTTYANVSGITRADKRNVLKPSGTYIRKKDRDPKPDNGNGGEPGEDDFQNDEGDSIPF